MRVSAMFPFSFFDVFITWSSYEHCFVQYLGSSFVLYVPSRLSSPSFLEDKRIGVADALFILV